jgi:hypothetical protein
MSPTRTWTIAAAALALCLPVLAHAPAPFPRPLPRRNLLLGQWTVTFSNGVVQTSRLRMDGTASVVEPNRSSDGKTAARDGVTVIRFADDRVERWTVRGKRVVVEHWFPASQYPAGRSVVGVARRSP